MFMQGYLADPVEHDQGPSSQLAVAFLATAAPLYMNDMINPFNALLAGLSAGLLTRRHLNRQLPELADNHHFDSPSPTTDNTTGTRSRITSSHHATVCSEANESGRGHDEGYTPNNQQPRPDSGEEPSVAP